jgi:ABC-type Fe3+-citrate transport system substrate-binding protein
MRRIPGTAEIPVIVYGLDEPGVPVDHIARLDITKVRIINDLSVNRIVESVLTAITNYRTMPK